MIRHGQRDDDRSAFAGGEAAGALEAVAAGGRQRDLVGLAVRKHGRGGLGAGRVLILTVLVPHVELKVASLGDELEVMVRGVLDDSAVLRAVVMGVLVSLVGRGEPRPQDEGGKAEGKLIFVSPAIDPETRAAKAIIELENADGKWRPGEFANAAIATSAQEVDFIVPKEAVQSVDGQNVIFVKSDKGFEKRVVGLGREDSRHVEIVSGLQAGEAVAVTGTFTLKAEFGKAEAEHAH